MQYTQNNHKQQENDILPTQQSLKSGLFISIGKGVSFFASLLVVTILGNFVPRETAGTYHYIIAIIGIISITTLPGMNQALVRTVAQGNTGGVWYLMRKRLLFGMIGSCIAIALGIFYWLSDNTLLAISFFIVSPFIPLTDTFSNFAICFWQGKKQFTRSVITHMAYYIGIASLSIPILILSDNLWIILTGILTAQFLIGFILFTRIKKYTHGPIDHSALSLGNHLTVIQGLRIFTNNIDRIIVWHLLGPIMVAVYTFASTPILKIYQMIPIGTVALPHLSNHSLTRETKKYILKKMYRLFLITIPGSMLLIFSAPFIFRAIFPLYPESILYFQILASGIMLTPTVLLKSALVAFKKTKSLYIIEIIIPMLKILCMILGATFFGLIGLCIGIIIAAFIDMMLSSVLFSRLSV